MGDDEKPDDKNGWPQDPGERMAMGMALGIPFGVVLSMLMDNWGMIGVGLAMGAAFGAIPWGQDDDTSDEDDSDASEASPPRDDEGPGH